MKTKLKLRNVGKRNHPYWEIVVQPERKHLQGRFIERVGYWMPRRTKTVQRGVVLNKHKVRYWLSIGAQPTNGVAKILNKYGADFWPKLPVPLGSASLYEKPEKVYKLEGYKEYFSEIRNPRCAYK